MDREAALAFLTADPPHTGKLATVRADGRPHVAPIWFALDGDVVVFTTGAETVKGQNLRREGRAAMCVDDERPPFSFVTVEGPVEIVDDDLDTLVRWATEIGGRYMGADQAEAFGRRNAVPGEWLVRLHVVHIASAIDVAD
ncbi:MAG TPA: PPOX class F420-dependent oxidoreductase [Acidimicrobiia bacterium]|nr:PPOX class F420-dependent oxidoreductase [Acidimicrobiia bacterium]